MQLHQEQVKGLLQLREEYLGRVSVILKQRWRISQELQDTFGPVMADSLKQLNFTGAHVQVCVCGGLGDPPSEPASL